MIFYHTLRLFYSGCRRSRYQRGLLRSALVDARSAAPPPTDQALLLHLEGFLIDTIEGKCDALLDMQGNQAYQSTLEYADFVIHRQ